MGADLGLLGDSRPSRMGAERRYDKRSVRFDAEVKVAYGGDMGTAGCRAKTSTNETSMEPTAPSIRADNLARCIPSIAGFGSILVQILLEKWLHPGTKQFGARTAMHRQFECLKPVDLAFGLTVAPGIQDGVPNHVDILT
jgi:hypothetical protein